MSPNALTSQEHPTFRDNFPFYIVPNHHRVYGARAFQVQVEENDNNDKMPTSIGETPRKISPTLTRKAQGALLDYLHSTRCLQFMDAEHMSKNSPHFLRKLMKHVGDDPNVERSMIRFLCYHPINEFEPFFESIGLKPGEFVHLLPRDLMFLSDEKGLLENYHALCEYGIARNKVGKIFRGAREVFRYDHGVLISKLQAFEEVGLSQSVVVEAVSSSPHLLIDDVYKEFIKVVTRLKCLGYEYNWVKGRLLENTSYNWRQIFELLCMLQDLGCGNNEVGKLIGEHPELLFAGSGQKTFSLLGFMLKLGSTKDDICSVFLQFPSIKVANFIWNLRRISELLTELDMDPVNIGSTIRPNMTVLGTLSIKRANSILCSLNTGKKRLCDIIIANPLELGNWVRGAKIKRLPEGMHSHIAKINFLLKLGFMENSKEMEKALKGLRGKGEELQERFDCLVQAGLSQSDVTRMIKTAPQILNQSKEIIVSKIEFLVNDLGYPVSSLKSFPAFISYTTERVKLRFSMYKWLTDQRVVYPSLSMSTFIGCTESYFMRRYVNKHPRGPEVWCELKKAISSV